MNPSPKPLTESAKETARIARECGVPLSEVVRVLKERRQRLEKMR